MSDFNGDGKADLAVADSGANLVTILLGTSVSIVASGGSNQSAPINTPFPSKLQVTVLDGASHALALLIEQLGMKQDRVAVELNRNIVPRADWAATNLAEGDQLEIVHFVGGGVS